MPIALLEAIYLELWLSKHPEAKFMWTTNNDETKGPDNVKAQYANRLERVRMRQAKLSTHPSSPLVSAVCGTVLGDRALTIVIQTLCKESFVC